LVFEGDFGAALAAGGEEEGRGAAGADDDGAGGFDGFELVALLVAAAAEGGEEPDRDADPDEDDQYGSKEDCAQGQHAVGHLVQWGGEWIH
jgi:hypothetical protein